MTFAEQILAHRERLCLSRAEAAALLDVSGRTYDYWESGVITPPHKVTEEGAIARMNPHPAISLKTP